MPSSSKPLSLSDDQLQAVMRACEALQPIDRDPFLRALANRLRGEIIGDCSIHRVIRELLRPGAGFFRPPAMTHTPNPANPSKLKSARTVDADAE